MQLYLHKTFCPDQVYSHVDNCIWNFQSCCCTNVRILMYLQYTRQYLQWIWEDILKHCIILGKQSQGSAASIFNMLPVEIRNINNCRTFCCCIKDFKNSEWFQFAL
jgi:hypothetical protein